MDIRETTENARRSVWKTGIAGAPLPVPAERVFNFPEGLPAFEFTRRFMFLSAADTQPFFFMHALETQDLSFVCVCPFLVCPGYTLNLAEADRRFLDLERSEDALVASIVTVEPDPHDITTNLKGPVVVNVRKRIGKQIIANGTDYPVRYRLWEVLGGLEEDAVRRGNGTP